MNVHNFIVMHQAHCRVVLSSTCSFLWCTHERNDPCPDVSVLWPGLLWTKDPKVPVVEEVLNHHPDGEYYEMSNCQHNNLNVSFK